MIYFCYGSNLNVEQMNKRCPNAKQLQTVTLKDYRLTFQSPYGRTGGVATIVPCIGSDVVGAMWDITPTCLKALDRYEGYPRLYERKDYIVVDETGTEFKVMSYYMNDGFKTSEPSPIYYNTIKQGFKDFGLDIKSLNDYTNFTIQEIAELRLRN